MNTCERITDYALECIADHMHALRSLDVSFCVQVTTDGLQRVVTHCVGLSRLRIAGLNQVDSAFKRQHASILALS